MHRIEFDTFLQSFIQLEEAQRLIRAKSVIHLRLALLLLDNAVEVILHEVIEEEFSRNAVYDTLLAHAEDIQDAHTREQIKATLGYTPIPKKRRRSIDRNFDEKLSFLTKDKPVIQQAVADALSHLHGYRNKAYHRNVTRQETLLPAVIVFFETVCDLLMDLFISHLGGYRVGCDDDADWLRIQQDYLQSAPGYLNGEEFERLIAGLRSGLPLDFDALKSTLVAHTTSRIQELFRKIAFVERYIFEGQPASAPMLEITLRLIQYSNRDENQSAPDIEKLKLHTPEYTVRSLANLDSNLTQLKNANTKIGLFIEFAAIEKYLEPIESLVEEAYYEVDKHIQLEIDVRRGK